jgi:hypothetical protein
MVGELGLAAEPRALTALRPSFARLKILLALILGQRR